MNVDDSNRMYSILKPLGFKRIDDSTTADVVILNTCHIREKAAEKFYSELGRINALQKKLNKKIIIIAAGCTAQAEGEEIFKRAPFVDIVVGPQSLHSLPELLTKVYRKQGKAINLDFTPIEKFDYLPEERIVEKEEVTAFLSIQEGCDKFCTFCCVPYTRGPEYSRTVEKIYREAMYLVSKGVKEITLLGQNVNAYHGKHQNVTWSLGKLLKYLNTIQGLERIRYTTSHPLDMHRELYEAHASCEKLMPFIHLPVQSGADRILRRMNRKHTVEEYLAIIDKMRRFVPNIAFSSDFIVGFPGETEEDFMATLRLVERVGYAQAYSFKYSPRPGTPGAEFPQQIAEEVKSERLQRLQALLHTQQIQYNQACIGKTMPVLFDRRHKNKQQIIGKTPYMQSVHTEEKELFGTAAYFKINKAHIHFLSGERVSQAACTYV